MWCDYLRALNKLGQDLRDPKNVYPEDFMVAHDNAAQKTETTYERERTEWYCCWEIEGCEREQQRQLRGERDAEGFIVNKSKFFGLVITDEEIIIKVLRSIDEYYSKGKARNICMFGSEHYKKANTLIFSTKTGGEIVKTVEVDLRTLKMVQYHGKYDQDTEYHKCIIDIVNKSASLIRERMKVAQHKPQNNIDMEVRIEGMIRVWDDAIPTMFIESVNLLTLTTSEGGLRGSVKEFVEKYEPDKLSLYGFGSCVANTTSTCINATRAVPKQ